MNCFKMRCLFAAVVSFGISEQVSAAEGGYSNYIPGFYGDIALAVEPSTALSIRNDLYFYHANDKGSVRSGAVGIDADITFSFNYLTFLYKPDIQLFGGQYAFGATPSVGGMDIDARFSAGGFSSKAKDDHYGLADITLIPGILYWSEDLMHYSLAFYVVAPVGDYDEDDLANSGLNYWTYEADFSVTYFNEQTGQDYSIVAGYSYNTENPDTDYQTGDELHVDFVLNQFLSESLALGVHGFHLQQIGKDSGDGALLGSFKARASGIGPALMWVPERYQGDAAFTLKWLSEFNTKNRLEGDHVFLSFMKSF